LCEEGCLPTRKSLSAAQPQPNDRGEVKALIASSALRRAALTLVTSSPTVQMRLESMA